MKLEEFRELSTLSLITHDCFGDVINKDSNMWEIHIDSRALEYFKKMADAVLNVLMRQYKDYLSLSEEELKALHEKTGYTFITIYYINCILYRKDNTTVRE